MENFSSSIFFWCLLRDVDVMPTCSIGLNLLCWFSCPVPFVSLFIAILFCQKEMIIVGSLWPWSYIGWPFLFKTTFNLHCNLTYTGSWWISLELIADSRPEPCQRWSWASGVNQVLQEFATGYCQAYIFKLKFKISILVEIWTIELLRSKPWLPTWQLNIYVYLELHQYNMVICKHYFSFSKHSSFQRYLFASIHVCIYAIKLPMTFLIFSYFSCISEV